jgi:hypothetical protein
MRKKSKNTLAITLGALGAGAGLMFLLDPDRGGRRRGFIGDKALHAAKFFGNRVDRRSHDAANRAQGLVAETSARVAKETLPDEVLVERVRSKIGRVVTHPVGYPRDRRARSGRVARRGAAFRKAAGHSRCGIGARRTRRAARRADDLFRRAAHAGNSAAPPSPGVEAGEAFQKAGLVEAGSRAGKRRNRRL